MFIDSVVIEVTRRCNAKCGHCLRGTAEDMVLRSDYVWDMFDKIDRIGSICFTGGEPSLASDVIMDCLEAAKGCNVEVGSFYIATNAIEVPDEFINAIFQWYMYCDDNEITRVDYSNDRWHPKQTEANIKKLGVLSFVGQKYDPKNELHENYLIAEGRGLDIGAARYLSHERYEYEIFDDQVTE